MFDISFSCRYSALHSSLITLFLEIRGSINKIMLLMGILLYLVKLKNEIPPCLPEVGKASKLLMGTGLNILKTYIFDHVEW